MKRSIFAIILVMLLASTSWGLTPGSCVQTASESPGGFVYVKLVCTGSPDDGALPNTAISANITATAQGVRYLTDVMSLIQGTHYLYTVAAYPTSGGTAPDTADVFILDANGEDLLGSVDGGTTANKGLNLIHATLKKTTMPYSHYLSMFYYPAVSGTLTLKVSNQTTASANYTVELIFVR